jgi:hypothetical protein
LFGASDAADMCLQVMAAAGANIHAGAVTLDSTRHPSHSMANLFVGFVAAVPSS